MTTQQQPTPYDAEIEANAGSPTYIALVKHQRGGYLRAASLIRQPSGVADLQIFFLME